MRGVRRAVHAEAGRRPALLGSLQDTDLEETGRVNLDAMVRELVAIEVEKAKAELRAEFASKGSDFATPHMSVAEAAEFLRCDRQRIYDLLSQGRLSRVKDGSRTLVLRQELRD